MGNKWDKIGRELGLSEDDLRAVQRKHPQDECFYSMLKRVKQCNFCWRMLYGALISVNEHETASKLQMLLTQQYENSYFIF